jgi:hypothetical protein
MSQAIGVTYRGLPERIVTVCWWTQGWMPVERRLRHICYHSPSGFQWGDGGSGSADLALSILADHFGELQRLARPQSFARPYFQTVERTRAWRLHQQFKADYIAGLPQGQAWQITAGEIERWVFALTAEPVP